MGIKTINVNSADTNYAHSIFDISEYTEFRDTVDALLNDGETMEVIEMEIMSWDYNRGKGIICLNYDSSNY